MISSPNVSKMYFDLYLHTNVFLLTVQSQIVLDKARHLIADFIYFSLFKLIFDVIYVTDIHSTYNGMCL